MTFELKDLIYICGYIFTIVGFVSAFRYKIKKVEDSNTTIKNIIFKEKGGLNLIDHATCKEYRDMVYAKIRVESEMTKIAFSQIEGLNQNIIKLMMHFKVEPIFIKRNQGNENEQD